jgi:CRISPR/Cas system CMR-associated protein Cmr1 (group 7 of RAMP superfamily)
MTEEKRDKRLMVLLRKQEWEDLQYMAKVKGLYVSEVVRLLLAREKAKMERKGEWVKAE